MDDPFFGYSPIGLVDGYILGYMRSPAGVLPASKRVSKQAGVWVQRFTESSRTGGVVTTFSMKYSCIQVLRYYLLLPESLP
jgi:hypothetical protein